MFNGVGSRRETYSVKSANHIEYGLGAVSSLEQFLEVENPEKALIITDQNILKAGVVDPVYQALVDIEVETFANVKPEPKLSSVETAADAVEHVGADLVIGLGGGSCMDTAKLAAVLPDHDIPIRDMIGMGNVPGNGRSTVLIPTTAGTGSEMTHIGVFSDGEDENNKKVIYSDHLFCDLAIVDPMLTKSLPSKIMAATGMDALSHAVEAYVSTRRTPYTDMLARRSIELIGDNLRQAVHQGRHNDEARYNMGLAAAMAGQAFVNSGLGAVHALTYPLGVEHDVGHGLANAVILPHVMEFNLPAEPERFADIAALLDGDGHDSEQVRSKHSVDTVKSLNADIELPNEIRCLGEIDREEFNRFADIALTHSKHNIARNPRNLGKESIIQIFEAAY